MIHAIITALVALATYFATRKTKSDPIRVYGNPAILITYPSGVRVLCSDRLVAADELGVSLEDLNEMENSDHRIKIEEI